MGTIDGGDVNASVTADFIASVARDPFALPAVDPSIFERPTPDVARELLGMVLLSTAGGYLTGGIIVETEAYLGAYDPGSHAATRGITARNRVMYGPPGHAYVYFTYGNHHMLNLVTEPEGTAGAVLIRAIEPVVGVAVMEERRGRGGVDTSNGPGKLAQALGIDLMCNGMQVGETLQVRTPTHGGPSFRIGVSGRIGLSAGSELPLRFFIEGNPYVSRGRFGSP